MTERTPLACRPINTDESFLSLVSVTSLRGVGEKQREKLEKLGLATVLDLLLHLPFRYQDKTHLTPMRDLITHQEALVQGHIVEAKVVSARRRQLICVLADPTGQLKLRFFHFSNSQVKQLKQADQLRCFGEVRQTNGYIEMVHPEYRLVHSTEPLADTLTPIYASTDGLGQKTLRNLIQQALALLKRHPLPDYLNTLVETSVPFALNEAIHYCHTPPPDADTATLLERNHPAQRRLALEELVAHQACLQKLKKARQQFSAPSCPPGAYSKQFLTTLGFSLTAAQSRACREIRDDMISENAMNRLIQGDVGCGKTVVAAVALLLALDNHLQAAIMAPTEILAEQHFASFTRMFSQFPINIVFLSGKCRSKSKKQALADIASGQAQLIVGTHALFQDTVDYHALALIVIDEQHRFGVHQRLKFQDKQNTAMTCHQLVLTATPIPRTLAMTSYAALDCSIIDELPPGRQAITTAVMRNDKRADIIERVAQTIQSGQQAYWVCTLIDESDVIESQAAEALFESLRAVLPDVSIGLLHGRMRAEQKSAVMSAFEANTVALLVATTVIEVGVDVPNATIMVIENAERLGLAQLHQLRGRVGRGHAQSFCVLLYQAPLSKTAQQRLHVMRSAQDGFIIAEQDLKIRGSGELLGTRQSGLPQYRLADIIKDEDLLTEARKHTHRLWSTHPTVLEQIITRWLGKKISFTQA